MIMTHNAGIIWSHMRPQNSTYDVFVIMKVAL